MLNVNRLFFIGTIAPHLTNEKKKKTKFLLWSKQRLTLF